MINLEFSVFSFPTFGLFYRFLFAFQFFLCLCNWDCFKNFTWEICPRKFACRQPKLFKIDFFYCCVVCLFVYVTIAQLTSTPYHWNVYSPYCSPYFLTFLWGEFVEQSRASWFCNHFFILNTLMFDLVVILLGEIRCLSHEGL